ncbi:major capsid protein [Pseudoalteromonas luteoviolacea]|uniref:major capsid protein n=1 Tax=Pseudoalteromonas luteoviolacea TaxID=43657 RepID=UPI001B39556C|nr:major capsid protein [Pseudoalteromonas luteoviolacea]MBQ4836045.1 major capsid protein [Pseudoalteromonas luteoviolacea]
MSDTYTPRALYGVVQKKKAKVSSLFLTLFFPNMYTFETEEVDIDKVDEAVNSAVFVAPEVNGKVIRTRGHKTSKITPASLKPKHDVDIKKTLKRRPGEAFSGELTKQQRRQAIITQNLIDEELAIQQTEEWMAVRAVVDGHYTCEGEGLPEPINVNFNRSPENQITLAGAASWVAKDRKTYDPMRDIEKYAVASEHGLNILICDQLGWGLLNEFDAISEKLETRRGSNSQLETALKDLGKDISYKGYLGDVLVVVYTGHRRVNGVKQNYLDDYTFTFGHSGIELARLYGAILDDDAIEAGMEETDRFQKVYKEEGDVAKTYTVTKSAPLMANTDPDGFVVIKLI